MTEIGVSGGAEVQAARVHRIIHRQGNHTIPKRGASWGIRWGKAVEQGVR